MRNCWLACLLAAILLSPAAQAADPSVHLYRVTVNESLTRLDVEACFADSLPHHFVSDDPLAVEAFLHGSILLDGMARDIKPRQGALLFPLPSDDNCLLYRVDLARIANSGSRRRGLRINDTLLLAPQTWTWRPWSTRGYAMEFEFVLPAGMAVSFPGQRLDNGSGRPRFRLDPTPYDWPATMLLGRLQQADLDVPGARLRVSAASGPADADMARTLRWLKPAALAVSTVSGRFPRPDVQVVVVPVGVGLDAAPWAQVTRGWGSAVQFYMNVSADWDVFLQDWIATHELSHLLAPFIDRRDAWLSEGLASYYQNLLRGRIGLLSEQEMWQAMADGFMRGRKAADSLNLRDATTNMRSRDRFRRVYWTGAALLFKGDVELRRRSGGHWSLDRILTAFGECCLAEARAWRARELLERFDAISGEDVFVPLHDDIVYTRFFPRLDDTWETLGIDVSEGEVRLQATTAQPALRRSLFKPERVAPTGD